MQTDPDTLKIAELKQQLPRTKCSAERFGLFMEQVELLFPLMTHARWFTTFAIGLVAINIIKFQVLPFFATWLCSIRNCKLASKVKYCPVSFVKTTTSVARCRSIILIWLCWNPCSAFGYLPVRYIFASSSSCLSKVALIERSCHSYIFILQNLLQIHLCKVCILFCIRVYCQMWTKD